MTGNVVGNVTGNASTATKLAATKNIYGNAFDGSADLTQAIAGNYGGTGVDNGSKTITLGGNILTASEFTTVGNYSTTLTSTGVTNITLPTSGTIATLAGTETLTNKTIVSPNLTGIPTAPTAASGTNTTQIATTAFVLTTTAAATPDATSILKGKVQLAGDLGGIAASPIVNSVGGSSSTTIHTAELLANAATDANTPNTIVKRDANGDFSATTITANLSGIATNVSGIVLGANGGTGIANTGKTINLGGNIVTANDFTTTGNYSTTLRSTGPTNVTLPTTGTLATLLGAEALSNKTINGLSFTSASAGFSITGGTSSKTLTLNDDATISGTNTGDQTITLTGDVTGSGNGSFSTSLANSGVTAGSYGTATQVPTLTVDAKGRVTNVANTTITGVSPAGSTMASGKIFVGNASNTAAIVDMSGDVTINNTGVTTIGANKITTSKINNTAVTYDKIQNVSASDKILGRVSSGAGVVEEIATTGTGDVVRAVSPTLTGTPTVPTATYPSNDGTIANTAYVTAAINGISVSNASGTLAGANGGTGVSNPGRTITLGGNVDIAKNFTTTGMNSSNASDITFKTTGVTVLELPLSGKLATMSDVSSSSIGGNQITGIINPINGGTGVANDNSKTITLGGTINTGANFTTTGVSGAGANITLKTTAATDITLPTSGTIATLAGTETFTSKTINAANNTILNISNTNIASNANIDDTKLATISTAGKVLNSATTATNANTADAIVARDANGAFSAGIISASLNGNASTATQLAATKNIYGNAFDGSTDVTGIIASTYGGTGNGYTKFTGPTSSERVFTLPDASATILTSNALVTVAQGGTGTSSATQNFVFAGPATGSSAGAPTFRALTAADLPAGSGAYISNSTSQQANSNFNISGAGIIGGSLTAGSFVMQGGSPNEFLKADGSVDSRSFATLAGSEALTNKTVNGLTLTALGTGFTIAGGSTTNKTLTVGNNANVSGTNTGDISIGGQNYLSLSGQTLTANAVDLSGTNVTGILAAERFPAMTGDITTTAGTLSSTISDNAITSSKIANSAVTLNKIASISAQKLLGNKSNSVAGAPEEISIGAGLALNSTTGELTASGAGGSLTNGKILVGNVSDVATEVTLSGDVSMTNAGVVTINAGVITTTDLSNAAVTYSKIQNMSAKTLIGNKLASTGAAGEITLGLGLALDATTGILSASGSGGTVTNVSALTIGTTGTDVTSTVANSTTTPTITLNIPDASATARGLVTTGTQTFAGTKTFNSDIKMGTARIGLGGGSGGTDGRNIAMGINALNSNTTGGWNVALGAYTLQNASTASSNVAVGNEVMGVSAPGNGNTGVGSRSLMLTTGSSNTAIGASSGATITSGSNNTFVGYAADADVVGRTNATAIGNGAIVTADNSIQLGNSAVTNIKTEGTLTLGNVTYPKLHNSIANQVLTINASGTASFAPNSSASLAGGVAGAIPYQSGVGVTSYTTAGTAGQILTSAGTGTPTWITTLPVINGGTGTSSLTANAVLLGNGTSAIQTVEPGASGNILTSNGTTWISVAAGAGISSIGNISATSNVKGAIISGTALSLTPADATNGGIVTTAAQTFAGAKTFSDLSVTGAINGSSTVSSTIAGFNAAITPVTSALTISSANAATYNGKVLVCSGSAFTVTFDNTLPVGFSCMILQSDNNTVSFAGTNNRYNYTSTSGIYAIATAMCYASGSVLLTGDLQ